MKKPIIVAASCIALTLCLSGCACEHENVVKATCTQGETCADCDEVLGEPKTHSYDKATCSTPPTCLYCGDKVGSIDPDNHAWQNGSCKACGAKVDYSSVPSALMNDEFRKCLTYFGVPYSETGLSVSNAVDNSDAGTYLFYMDGLEFIGEECDDDQGQPRIVYDAEAIESGTGTPNKIFFCYFNALKSNGHKETMDVIEGIEDALGIEIEVDNDYTSSSKSAIGKYCSVNIPKTDLMIEVTNTDGTVEVEILPAE